jgi:cytochrome c-type biogenesis protein CcmH
MILWVLAGLLSALVVALLAWPLLRPARDTAERASDLAVYKDQLAELDRDVARGVLPAAEAVAARLEIQRRLLAAGGKPGAAAAGPTARSPQAAKVALALLLLLPIGALAIYLDIGHPGLTSEPFASRAPAPAANPQLADLADKLAAKMKANPDDPRGWALLAGAEADLGRFADSAAAYRQAITRVQAKGGTPSAELQSRYGEALAAAAEGQVTEPAKAAFAAALAVDPTDPRARFYLALAEAQAGHLDRALVQWVAIEAQSPADAPWRPMVAAQIEAAAKKLGRDPATLPGRQAASAPPGPASQAGPSAADMAKAAAMTPEQRAAFIDSMVAGLAARLHDHPEDVDGWLRLASAYDKLGRVEAARGAWREAASRAPDRLEAQLGYAASAVPLADKGDPPADFAAAVQRIRKLAPGNALGLYCAGLVARARGDKAEARALWQQVLTLLPAGTPQRQELEAKLAALGQ